jgi:hypothetical protein
MGYKVKNTALLKKSLTSLSVFSIAALLVTGCSELNSQESELEIHIDAVSFDYFTEVVQPILLRPRGGFVGSDAACATCHTGQATTPMPLATPQLDENGRAYWTDVQAVNNYLSLARLVDQSSPAESRLLQAPLSPSVGGRRHTGGAFWSDTQNSEYRLILEWAQMDRSENLSGAVHDTPDFEFFQSCVQPIFVNPIEGAAACSTCHGGEFARLPSSSDGMWTISESRQAFEDFTYLLEPGFPEYSRFMGKLLHPDAGGDLMHNGGRRWSSADDPERVALASWIRGELSGSDCPPSLTF